MRLSDFEISSIRDAVSALDPKARVHLFGSRVDNAKRGGDIDLIILSDLLSNGDRSAIRRRLWELIGEQKIDIVIAKDASDPFVRIALKEGAPL